MWALALRAERAIWEEDLDLSGVSYDLSKAFGSLPMEHTARHRHRPRVPRAGRGGYGGCKYSVPCYLHRTRHVPGVIKHDSGVIFTWSNVYSHLRPHSFTPCLISQRSCTVARGEPCRSTPDASVSVQDTSWAPHTPIPTIGTLGTRRILTQDD